MKKAEIRAQLRAAQAAGAPFWGVGAGPETAAAAIRAGAAWLVANHTVRYSTTLPASIVGLMPFADANTDVLAMGPALTSLPVPVLAAAFAVDQFRTHAELLRTLRQAGYDAIQNFPSTGMAEGKFSNFLTESDMAYAREVDLVCLASSQGFFTSALVFSLEQAEEMLRAGADMLVVHPGFTADGEHRLWSALAKEAFGAVESLVRDSGSAAVVVRSAYSHEEWPPRLQPDGIGVQYDGNYPDNTEAQA